VTPARDVVVIGGGAMGGAAAVHLLDDPAFDGRVTIIERDATYRRASSALIPSRMRRSVSNVRCDSSSAAKSSSERSRSHCRH